jgi:hypothetical protein
LLSAKGQFLQALHGRQCAIGRQTEGLLLEIWAQKRAKVKGKGHASTVVAMKKCENIPFSQFCESKAVVLRAVKEKTNKKWIN